MSTVSHTHPMRVLHVEDEPDDAFLVEWALRHNVGAADVRHVASAEEAIAYLSGSGKYADRQVYPLPDLLIVDRRLSGADGFALLEWVQERQEFGKLPRVLLSSGDNPNDRQGALSRGAHAFFAKGFSYAGLCEWVRDQSAVASAPRAHDGGAGGAT